MYRSTKITTKAVFDMETGELLHWEGYDYCGPLDLCEGEPAANDPGTQDAGGGDAGDTQGGGGDESYFLEVDDRTRYRTAEDAKTGFQEASQRIIELTPWQQIASEYGLTDPQDVAALLDELAELRARAAAPSAPERGSEPTRTAPTQANIDPNSPEGKQAAALAWLKENGVQAGLVNNDQLSEIAERLEFLTSEAKRVDDERFLQRMEYGRNVLTEELKNAGYWPTDPKDTAGIQAAREFSAVVLEDALTNWINADDRRVAAFHAGGESLANLIKTGLQRILPTFNVLRNSSSANDAARRNANASRGATRQTAAGAAAVRAAGVGARPAARTTGALKPEDGITPDVHERAWEVAKKIFGDRA